MRISDWSSDVCSSDLIAALYTAEFKRDLAWLGLRDPAKWTVATDYVQRMIAFAERIADAHCYELDSGLSSDVSTLADDGRLAGEVSDEAAGRNDQVQCARHAPPSARERHVGGDRGD